MKFVVVSIGALTSELLNCTGHLIGVLIRK